MSMETSSRAEESTQEITLRTVTRYSHSQAVSSGMKQANTLSALTMIPRLEVLSHQTVKIDRMGVAVRV